MQKKDSNCDKVNWEELEIPLKKEEASRLLDQVVGWQILLVLLQKVLNSKILSKLFNS